MEKFPLIYLDNITKCYNNGNIALKDLSLQVHEGEFLSLLGPSGCGKSTTLRLVSGLAHATSGRLRWSQHMSQASGNNLGFVFQDPTLMPWATVFSNVHLPLKLKGVRKKQAHDTIMQALQLVDLEEFKNAYPRELSGGMRMRASIARALVTQPKILLMDEPFAALDEINRFKLNDKLLELWQKFNWTVIFVTHSVFEAVYLSNRIVIMAPRPGYITESINVPMSYPRDMSWRTSEEYILTCQSVSMALQKAVQTNKTHS